MPKRPPQDDDEPSAEEMLAAVTKDFQESGLSFSEYFYGVPEPPDDGRPQLTPFEWMQAPELIEKGKKALEVAEQAVAAVDQAYKRGEQMIEFVRQAYERADEAQREKHRQDSARGGAAKPKRCPGVFAFLKRRITEIRRDGDWPSGSGLLAELPTDGGWNTHCERYGPPQDSVEALIWHDTEAGCVVENRKDEQEVPVEVGRIKVGTFRDYFTKAQDEYWAERRDRI